MLINPITDNLLVDFLRVLAENSLNAAVKASVSRALKNTNYLGGLSVASFLRAKSTPYFRATLSNDFILLLVISILVTPAPCLTRFFKLCLP